MTKFTTLTHTLALCLGLCMAAQVALAGDETQQRFVFFADPARDNGALRPEMAPRLVAKAVAHAQKAGFSYGDEVVLRTVPGVDPDWDRSFMVLKSANTHPHQLEPFLVEMLSRMGQRGAVGDPALMWGLQTIGDLDCSTPTVVYAFTNGLNSATPTPDGFEADGTAAGAMANCTLVWVGLGLVDAAQYNAAQRAGLDNLFRAIGQHAGAKGNDILR